MLSEIRGFLKYSWGLEKKYIIFLVLNQLVLNLMIIYNLIIPKFIIDELFITKDYSKAVYIISVTIVVNVVCNLGTNYLKYFAEKSRDSMYTKYNIAMSKEMLKVEYSMLENPEFHNLRMNAIKCMTAEFGFAGIIVVITNLIGKLILIISLSFVISFLNFWVLLIFLCLIVLNVHINSKIKKSNINLDFEMTPEQRKSDYFRDITNSIEYSKEIRINVLQNWILGKYKFVINQIKVIKEKKNRNLFLNSTANNFIEFLENSILYATLIFEVLYKTLSQGDFVMYLGTIAKLNSSITEAFGLIADINKCKLYFKPFNEFMSLNKVNESKKLIKQIDKTLKDKPCIEFVDVSFKYPGQTKYALQNVNVKIMENEKISILGENGAGKTTFVKLMTRLYKPSEGKILLYGVDINEYDYDEYMKLFSVIFQDYKLFSLSIKENICLNEDGLHSEEVLRNIISEVGLEERIRILSAGLDTQIGKNFDETGIEPSGGEGQKIAIARAIYKNSPILILDEPTAALDPRAEYEIYINFSNLTAGKTAFYISHRLTSRKFCDRILVFENGRITENGTHEQLIENNGLYYDLFNKQAQFYI